MNYCLKNNQLTVCFSSTGGQIVSVKDKDDLEYLWQGDSTYWSGQAPVLFPICGSLRDKKAIIGNNKTCNMERHGLVRKLEFECVQISDTSITFSIQSDDKLRMSFPYDFELQITYTLKAKTVTTHYKVFNKENTKMPFFIGGHPGFRCPLLAGESFEDYCIEFEHPETAFCPESIPQTGLINVDNRTKYLENENILPLKHSYFAVDGLIFDQLRSRFVTLKNPTTGKGIREDFYDFDYFVLWTSANNGPFIAMEPWTGISTCSDESDIFEEKRGVKFINGNDSMSLSFGITIL